MPKEDEVPGTLPPSINPTYTYNYNPTLANPAGTTHWVNYGYGYNQMPIAVMIARADQATLDAIRQIVREELEMQREAERDRQRYEENQE